jgi:O-antigen ligase
VVQFIFRQIEYSKTGQLSLDPTLLNRVTGFLGHWMTFSGVLLLVWCAAIPALAVLARGWIAAVIMVGAGLLVSFTRGVWLAAAAGFAFVALTLPRRILAAVILPLIIVAVVSTPLIYRRIAMSFDVGLATNYSRMVYIDVGTKMIAARPLFGVGPERIQAEFPAYYAGDALETFYSGHLHNNFLQIAAERGLIALTAFLWFLAELYRSLVSLLRLGDAVPRWAIFGALAALTGFIVAGLTEYNFGDSEVLVLFLFLVSIPFGLTSNVQEDPDRQQG